MTYPLPNVSFDLTGQVALVTGASSGLGLRFAKVLAASGAKVALASRRIDRLETIAQEIRDAGGQATAIQMDATDADQLVAAVDKAERDLGQVNTLINNAGIPDAARAHKMPVDLIDRVFDTNLRGPWILACEVAKRLIAAKAPGRIVNISSMGAFNYNGNGAALYSVTKAGIVRMTEALAVEWAAFNINVNAIAPGTFSSEMIDGMVERVGDGFMQNFPRKRIGRGDQLDSTLLYLVSPSSDFITGTVIKADDGQMSR